MAPPAQHPRTGGLGLLTAIRSLVRIRLQERTSPFIHISSHVKKAKLVGGIRAYGGCFTRVGIGFLRIVGIAVSIAIAIRAFGSPLPLRFSGKPLSRPLGVSQG